MIRIQSEEQLKSVFREIDRDQLHIPPEMHFPFLLRDYVAWMEPSGHRTYLLFNDADKPLGVTFKRVQQSADAPAMMCEWCHSVRSGGRVGMLSVDISKNRRIGMHLCRDLSCRDKIIGLPQANDLPTRMSRQEKINRLIERMSSFLHGNLF